VRRFYLVNAGDQPAGITDAQALVPPFSWTTGSYPGTSQPDAQGVPPCSAEVPARSTCVLSARYSGEAGGSGRLALRLTNAYTSDVVIALKAQYTDGALLKLFLEGASVPLTSGPYSSDPSAAGRLEVPLGHTRPFHVIVHNRGGGPTRSLSLASQITLTFSWGQTAAGETFPGGTGSAMVDGASYAYCTGVLEPGQSCVLGFKVSPTQLGCRNFRLGIAYITTSSQDIQIANITACGIAAEASAP
jgi:hypothetical protein